MSIFEDPSLQSFITKTIEAKARLLETPGEKGSFDCPKCGAKVEVRLVGRKSHVRAACPTEDCWSLMQ